MGVFLPEIELPLDYRDRDFFGGVFEENLLLRHKKNHRAPGKLSQWLFLLQCAWRALRITWGYGLTNPHQSSQR